MLSARSATSTGMQPTGPPRRVDGDLCLLRARLAPNGAQRRSTPQDSIDQAGRTLCERRVQRLRPVVRRGGCGPTIQRFPCRLLRQRGRCRRIGRSPAGTPDATCPQPAPRVAGRARSRLRPTEHTTRVVSAVPAAAAAYGGLCPPQQHRRSTTPTERCAPSAPQ